MKTQGLPGLVLGHTRTALVLFLMATAATITAQTWWAVMQDKDQTLAAETTNGLVAVRLLEEHASQTLQDAVHTLDQVVRSLPQERGAATPERIRKLVARYDLSRSRHLKALQYASPDGVSWISSPDYPTHQSVVAYRNDIQFLISHPSVHTAVVGHPYASNYDSQWVIPVSRTIFDASDRPLGVLSVDVRLSYFGALYSRVAKENNASVSLFAEDGFIVVRSPFEARYVDRDISTSPLLKTLQSGPVEGSFSDEVFLDDDPGPKLYAYRKVAGFPITTVYARDHEIVLHPWMDRTHDRILFAGAALVLTIALTLFLLIYVKLLQRSQTSLQKSESKFISFFQHSPIACTLVRQSDGHFVEANESWLYQFGYQREQVIERTALELGLWVEPQRRAQLMQALARDGLVDRFEVRHRHKQGQVLVCLISARIFQTDTGELIMYTLLDITRQRAAEQEIRDMNQQLEQRVQARTEKLEAANLELEQALASMHAMQAELVRSEKMAALGALVAGVAHELNTPIGNSVTVGSTLQHQVATLAEELQTGTLRRSGLQHFLDAAVQGTEILMRSLLRADQLISSFKRVSVDQSSDMRRNFDLQTVLQEVCLTLEPMYKKTPYDLTLDVPENVAMDSFPGALGQLVTNFISNAIQHGFEGRTSGHMRLSAKTDGGGTVTLEFSDDGIGVSQDTKNRIFDPFFTTKLGQGGSGLGMNIVYNIVKDVLGGSIEIDTAINQGVCIRVHIPTIAPITTT